MQQPFNEIYPRNEKITDENTVRALLVQPTNETKRNDAKHEKV